MKVFACTLLLLRCSFGIRQSDQESPVRKRLPTTSATLFPSMCPEGMAPRQSPFGPKAAAFEEVFRINVKFDRPAPEAAGGLKPGTRVDVEVQIQRASAADVVKEPSASLGLGWLLCRPAKAKKEPKECGKTDTHRATFRVVGVGTLEAQKQSFVMDFGEETRNWAFGSSQVGLRANNPDCTGVKEPIAASLYSAVCAHTYQVAIAELYINGHFKGVYVVAEWFNEQFVQREFGSLLSKREEARSTVWDAHSGTGLGFISNDVMDIKHGCFSHKAEHRGDCRWWRDVGDFRIENGRCCRQVVAPEPIWRGSSASGDPYEALQVLSSTLDPKQSSEEIVQRLSKIFDVNTMLRQMAVDFAIGHFDGYWRGLNNYMMFQWWPQENGSDTRIPHFSMLEFDFDMVFSEVPIDPFEFGDSSPWNELWDDQPQAPLATHLLRVTEYRDRFDTFLAELLRLLVENDRMHTAIQHIAEILRSGKSRELNQSSPTAASQCNGRGMQGWQAELDKIQIWVRGRTIKLNDYVTKRSALIKQAHG